MTEFAEQTAIATRTMYAAPNRRTTHRLVALDVPTPSWMRAPGECPGMYALESAMDELARRLRASTRSSCGSPTSPTRDPEKGIPFSSRNLVACLREGAERFGWADRDPTPGARRDGRWLVGTGVAASTYPAYRSPSQATVRASTPTAASRSGSPPPTSAPARAPCSPRSPPTRSASPPTQVRMEIGDSDFAAAALAGGSMGTASWGSAVVQGVPGAARAGRRGEATADTAERGQGAQARAARATRSARSSPRCASTPTPARCASRACSACSPPAAIINPKTARSQFIGGMTMGISMALHEESVMDREFGDYVNHDLAQYHVPACADVQDIEAHWIDEDDDQLNPMGSKGIGEIGIVGTAAAVANAVHHATGMRVRDLPIRLDRLVD